ncbi:MAG: universal stress protein [Planctomycetaceae bacterium]
MTWHPKQTVVVPIDFSGSTKKALETAVECAFGVSNVHVVHVVWAIDPPPPTGTWNADDIAVRRQMATQKAKQLLQQYGMSDAEIIVMQGDPGTRIVEYAEQVNADLIVIPSHGYSGLKRVLLGSTAERVIRHASCPVYVLRRDNENKENQNAVDT